MHITDHCLHWGSVRYTAHVCILSPLRSEMTALCAHVLNLSYSHLRGFFFHFSMILRHLNNCSADITMNKETKYLTLFVELSFKRGGRGVERTCRTSIDLEIWISIYFFLTDWCSWWHYVDLSMLSEVMDKRASYGGKSNVVFFTKSREFGICNPISYP